MSYQYPFIMLCHSAPHETTCRTGTLDNWLSHLIDIMSLILIDRLDCLIYWSITQSIVCKILYAKVACSSTIDICLLFTIADNLNILNCKKRSFVSQYKIARLSVHDVNFMRSHITWFFVLGRILGTLSPTDMLNSCEYMN